VESETEKEVSSLNGKVSYLCTTCMLFLLPTPWKGLLQFGAITKHTWWWETDERNLKIMNLTHFHPKKYRKFGKKQQFS